MEEGAPLPVGFTVAVIAAGATGASLAWMAARAGFITVVEDLFPSNLRDLAEQFRADPDWKNVQTRMSFSMSIEDAVRDADFVIDLVPDELESKLEIFSLLDRMTPPRTIFCSPMREVSISDLQACTYRAAQCIAVRPCDWSSVEEITLLSGNKTNSQTVAIAREVWQRMGKVVRLVHDD